MPPWRRRWLPTPVFLPGESHGRRSLAGCSPRDRRVRHGCATGHTHRVCISQSLHANLTGDLYFNSPHPATLPSDQKLEKRSLGNLTGPGKEVKDINMRSSQRNQRSLPDHTHHTHTFPIRNRVSTTIYSNPKTHECKKHTNSNFWK